MGPSFYEVDFFEIEKKVFCLISKVKSDLIFETFVKKTFNLICHTKMYDESRDIIEETDEGYDDNDC